ncbi:MAG: 2-amino-4-hydroxy-6-hydroxymethyldihydropteridine diphosphokinase [Myxococcota bacterium]
MARAYLGFGANLGDPRAALSAALPALSRAGVEVLAQARLYSTAPVGPQDQPRYLNTVLEVETALSPEALLAALKRIEEELGRVPSVRWGPRAIDLDILLYDALLLDTPSLRIPHRELGRRRFVLAPLADLAPAQVVPGLGQRVDALLAALPPEEGAVEPLQDA